MSKRNKVKNTQNTLVDISILTACEIDPKIFQKCLEAAIAEAETTSSKINVFFNGATELKPQYDNIVAMYPNVSVAYEKTNKGYAYGANRAIRMGNSPLVLFVSDDVILHKGSLEKLVHRMDDPSIGNCGLKLLFPEDSQDPTRPAGKVQHVGHGIDIRGEIVHPLIGWSSDNPKCNISRDVMSVTGAAFMIRRNVFKSIGGFCEQFAEGYFEDVDMNIEIIKQGHRVFIDTSATATHYVGTTFAKHKTPPPLENNKMLLRARKANLFQHTSWMFW